MKKYIMVGCDLHEGSMVLKIAEGREPSIRKSFKNRAGSRKKMIAELKRRAVKAGAERVIFAYEACGFGFVLCDELAAGGIECYVLAPTLMPRSTKRRRMKNDDRDAEAILQMLRNYVLAGTELPSIWIPDLQTRDARERVRRRLDLGERLGTIKTQIRWLLYRNGIEKPISVGENWSISYMGWLVELAANDLGPGTGAALDSMLRQHDWLVEEKARMQREVEAMSCSDAYRPYAAALCRYKGVGVLTAMTFLTELGDAGRFGNRRALGCYLGLTPTSDESGKSDDHKGHITRQGPARVRKMLCQAIWSRIGCVDEEAEEYYNLVARNPKKKKIAIVARMRHLGILLWHEMKDIQDGLRPQAAA